MASPADIAYALGCAVLAALGGFVLRREPGNPLHRSFASFAFLMGAWLASLRLLYVLPADGTLDLVGRFNFAAVAAAMFAGHAFAKRLVGKSGAGSPLLTVETVTLVATTLLTPLVSASETRNAELLVTEFGPLFPLFILHVLGYLGSAAHLLISEARTASPILRTQLRSVLVGFLATAAFALTTNVALPYAFGYFGLQQAGALSVALLVGCFAHAILAARLFDLRVAVRRTTVFAALVGSAVAIYGALTLGATAVLRREPLSSAEFIYNLAAVALVGLSAEPIRRWISARTDAWLFQEDYDQREALRQLNGKLSSLLVEREAMEAVSDAVRRSLRTSWSAVAYLSDGDGPPDGPAMSGSAPLPPEALLDLAQKAKGSTEPSVVGDRVLAVPVSAGGAATAVLLIGSKLSGRELDARDVGFAVLAGQAAGSAIQRARLYEGDRNKTEFVSIAAHELLTPIAAMQGYLSMVLVEGLGTVDDRARRYLERVSGSAARLSALVRDLLSVSRLESGRLRVDPVPTDLSAAIREAVEQLAPSAEAKGLELTFDAGPLPSTVLADPARLAEVLTNLIGNAIKYTPKGTVAVTARQTGAFAYVAVRDTGLGMSKEEQARLFEKFYRVRNDGTADIEGTGLGLYLTKSMVESMGGRISVSSVSGRGSTFTFALPLS